MFQFDQQEAFAKREERILAFWQKENIFKQSLDNRCHGPLFSFYDGPPFATGLPHYGHLLAGTIKDVIPRYKSMKGFYVPRRFGWDCHGLPVENEIEKAKELSGAPEIEAFGIAKFNEECRSIVFRYAMQWENTVSRMGRWVDFEKTYRTMDLKFMESVWWAFSQLYAKGLVYEGFKVMPFSTKLGTPISNFEANLNYRDVDDPSITLCFPLKDQEKTFFLAWTTTPWSLPANLALAVGPKLDYVKIKHLESGNYYILSKSRLPHYFKNPSNFSIEETIKGHSLVNMRYLPPFPYFAQRQAQNAFRVLIDDFVTDEDGTGIVSIAPAFGEIDFFICSKEGIEMVCPVDQNGKFTQEVPQFAGLYVKDADKEIIKYLKQKNLLFHQSQVHHRYPFCWRSDTPLIYKAVRTWFVAVEKIKDKLLASNEQIHWVPEHIKEGRFGNWLENARDWAISRNRYWGTPIPIWRSSDGEIIVIGSIEELEKRTGKKIHDIHRHFIDDLTFIERGKQFRRISEVFDCWFESGSMPYGQNHYPFENKNETLKTFPADFIGEGLDQTRGWFYTLTILSTALFNQPAFKNVIVNGIILAEDGAKMSKRLKNYPEPEKVINEYGADAIRLFFLNSAAVIGDDLKFSEKAVELVLRQALIPFWNSFVFLATYASIYKWRPEEELKKPKADIDQWILSLLQKLTLDVSSALDTYHLNLAVAPLVGFIDQLTNWYIRRSRARFWSEKDSLDRREAFATLYEVVFTLSKIAAPFIPFLTEAIYLELKKESDPLSVHLCDYPKYQANLRNEELEKEMNSVQVVVSLGHFLRKENKIKVRQPLKKAHIVSMDEEILKSLKRQNQLICDELNVKEALFSSNESQFVKWSAKPNFRVLGKKVGPLMQEVQKIIQNFTDFQVRELFEGRNVAIQIEGNTILLSPEDVSIDRKALEGLIAATQEGITVVLDTELNESLLLEGLSREIINKINTMRRESGFAVTDRIHVTLETTDRVKKAFDLYKDLICHEVLALEVKFEKCVGEEWDLNGEKAVISLNLIT